MEGLFSFESIFGKLDPSITKIVFHIKYSDKDKKNELDAWSALQDDIRKKVIDEPICDRWMEMNRSCIPKETPQKLYLLTFAQYLDYGINYYVFGGYYEFNGESLSYNDKFDKYRGRLIVKRAGKNKIQYCFDYEKIKAEGMPEFYAFLPYDEGISAFSGYENVCLKHKELFRIFDNSTENKNADWIKMLGKVKAVYCITDTSNGKIYIGSANSVDGLSGRWQYYAKNDDPTGENKYFCKLVKNDPLYLEASNVSGNGLDHIRDNFQYTILEIFDVKTDERIVRKRERFWKKAFCTVVDEDDMKTKKGMNMNW